MKEILETWKAHYKRLAAQNILGEGLVEPDNFPKQKPGGGDPDTYSRLACDQGLMANVVMSLQEGDDNESILSMINNDEWEEQNPESFKQSLESGKRSEYLTYYTVEELSKMRLFKLKGHNVGYAIKDNEGDIVSVHNNSGVGGLGVALIESAKRNGGKKLDHFDGFLTGFYKKNGFAKVTKAWAWDDQYAPENWKYEPVNIFDPRKSIHAKELAKYDNIEDVPDELKAKIRSYEEGRPDVVFRELG